MKFSQRIGKRTIKTVLQVDSMDNDLRNRLWNLILEDFFDKLSSDVSFRQDSLKGKICKLIWKEFYNYPIDTIPSYSNSNNVHIEGFMKEIRDWFYVSEWYDVYDFIEFIVRLDNKTVNYGFGDYCNRILEKEVSGYRIINEKVVQITSDEEIDAIEQASANTDNWTSVSTHLKAALDNLSDRKNPNYRNSIKESISAVESLCKIITNDDKATLGGALAEIEKKHQIHGALKTAFSAIYGYTSDSGGIRHALLESDAKPEFEDAKFMLVSCSAFINYLKSKVGI